MKWSVIEGLVGVLAWPITALIIFFCILPLAKKKFDSILDAINRLHSILASSKEVIDLLSRIERSSGAIADTNNVVQTILTNQKLQQAEQEGEDVDADLVTSRTEPTKELVLPPMHEQLAKSWGKLLDSLTGAYKRAELGEPDKRGVGRAALRLTQSNISNPIPLADVETIARLHGTYKRFARLRRDNPDLLTERALEAFELDVDRMIDRLENVGKHVGVFD